MATWGRFEEEDPELAGVGRRRLEERGLALVATLRRDGSPRIGAVEPYLVDGRLLLGMIWRSRKALDLLRDPRCAVAAPICDREAPEGDFKVRGRAVPVEDPKTRRRFADAVEARIDWRPEDPYHLFEVDLESVTFTRFEQEGMGGSPVGARRASGGARGGGRPPGLALPVAALEPLHPAPRVDQLLLPRVEGVAGRADLHVDLRLGGPGLEGVPAGAPHHGLDVFGMDPLLHSLITSSSG